MKEELFCQSCGMPMPSDHVHGTNADASQNIDYCMYCFKEGQFTQEMTMDEMIEHCASFVEEFNKNSDKKFTREEAVSQMKVFFPHLKRWKK